MSGPVNLELVGHSAIVSLDAPPLNIFNLEMRDGLIEALEAVRDIALQDGGDLRVMILRSTGEHFSAGADLSEFATAESIHEARRIRWDRDPWALLWDMAIPTIAAISGVAVGSGLEMALLCDLRVAGRTAKLGLPETKLAMLPAAGGTQSLTRAVGPHQALPIVALAETMNADEALRRGVISQVADDANAAAEELAATLAGLRPNAVQAMKRALHAAGDLPLDAGLAVERQLSTALDAAP